MVQIATQPGIQNNQDGSALPTRAGKQGEVMVSELHGRYYEQAYRSLMFRAAHATPLTTSAGAIASGTGFVGCGLYNPTGSGVNLVINKHGFAYLVAFAAASTLGLQVGFAGSVGPTAITPMSSVHNALAKGSATTLAYAGAAQTFSGITIASTGNLDTILGVGLTGAITTEATQADLFDLEGGLIIPPGGFVATYTSTASGTSAAVYSFCWEEVPV